MQNLVKHFKICVIKLVCERILLTKLIIRFVFLRVCWCVVLHISCIQIIISLSNPSLTGVYGLIPVRRSILISRLHEYALMSNEYALMTGVWYGGPSLTYGFVPFGHSILLVHVHACMQIIILFYMHGLCLNFKFYSIYNTKIQKLKQ